MNRQVLSSCMALIIVIAGCGSSDPEAAPVAAAKSIVVIDNRPVDADIFEAFVRRATGKSSAELNQQTQDRLLDQLIGLELAAEQGRAQGFADRTEVRAQFELGRLNALADAYLADYVGKHPATPEEVEAEYRVQSENAPREYKARHILVETRSIAESIVRELDTGADFAALAKQESKDASAASGGDLGWFTLDGMPSSIGNALLDLAKGRYTAEPVQSPSGWHVILLEDVRKPPLPPLDSVREKVVQIVQRKKIERHLEALRGAAAIQKTP